MDPGLLLEIARELLHATAKKRSNVAKTVVIRRVRPYILVGNITTCKIQSFPARTRGFRVEFSSRMPLPGGHSVPGQCQSQSSAGTLVPSPGPVPADGRDFSPQSQRRVAGLAASPSPGPVPASQKEVKRSQTVVIRRVRPYILVVNIFACIMQSFPASTRGFRVDFSSRMS